MLLKSLKVTNSQGLVLDLPLGDSSGGFVVRKIEGLDPVKATLVSSSFANMDGEQFHSSRRDARNIILELGLRPDFGRQAVKTLRDQLYQFLMPETRSKLSFHLLDQYDTNILTRELNLEIFGRIETFESALFARDPEVKISVMCFNPDFVDPEPVIFEGMSVSDLTETALDYEGTTDTGVKFTLIPNRLVPDFMIYVRPPSQRLQTIHYTEELISSDYVEIGSVQGSKYVTAFKSGVLSSRLYAVSPQSHWITLEPGENQIRVYSDGAPIPYTIEYTRKYGGL